ncbi:hypothetical protein PR202_ga20932 [Eleusine coracana subsp. coracana]|uniref:Alpha/beta hydrolase fold-3 domain-containing protein n=1 Tax=Eleusine coracana subsp. coracana TaxID=191504 RepID=A0AAV5CZR5_ELECO|nr:hypothetical protein PR202_ga20932 [Eleusine coracana subsp. coracana]
MTSFAYFTECKAASSAVTAADTPPRVVEDCRGVLRVLSDGTVVRFAPPVADDVPVDPSVEWKGVVYDAALGLGLRVYRPAGAAVAGDREKLKLPVVVVFHGGGFCIGAYALPTFHAACTRLAAGTSAIVLSADYRLAPEHRLAAAADDAAVVLLWLRDHAASDPWISELADLGKVFVTGESAGGVLAHHLNVPFSGVAPAETLDPVRLRGFVPLMPFFAGGEPTRSELSCRRRPGADADHPFGPDSPRLDGVVVGPTLVVVAGEDILRDRNVEYVRRMAEMGKPVEHVEFPWQGHAFFSLRPWAKPVDEFVRVLKRFMDKQLS